MKAKFVFKGGAGSGHHGHAGREGKRGGSLPGTGGGSGENIASTAFPVKKGWNAYAYDNNDVPHGMTKVVRTRQGKRGVYVMDHHGYGRKTDERYSVISSTMREETSPSDNAILHSLWTDSLDEALSAAQAYLLELMMDK